MISDLTISFQAKLNKFLSFFCLNIYNYNERSGFFEFPQRNLNLRFLKIEFWKIPILSIALVHFLGLIYFTTYFFISEDTLGEYVFLLFVIAIMGLVITIILLYLLKDEEVL